MQKTQAPHLPLKLIRRGTKEQGDGANYKRIIEAVKASFGGVRSFSSSACFG